MNFHLRMRVLTSCCWDFDTRIPYKRENIHSQYLPTYKFDVANLFCGNPQYTLIEKRSFSHLGRSF